MSQSLKVGDLVRKRAGYEYPGIIVSVFTTRAGATRYVVEADHPGFEGQVRRGLLAHHKAILRGNRRHETEVAVDLIACRAAEIPSTQY